MTTLADTSTATKNGGDDHRFTLGEAQRLIAARELSPEELVAAHLARIDRLNPHLNAIVTLDAEEALRQARKQANDLARGRRPGVLAGIPFTAKDCIATAGMRTTFGSAIFVDHIPSVDAPAVARLRRAGAILIGKTNCPEFAFGIHTWSPLFGHTRSPIGEFSPGGSSGGEAAAVAAGLSLFGLGTDFGGSLRWPAACTGLVALRTTPGRVPTTGQYPPIHGGEIGLADTLSLQGRLQVIGPVVTTVADAVLIGRVISGPDRSDSASVPAPFGRLSGLSPSQLRLAWCDGGERLAVASNVAYRLHAVLTRLLDAGVHCEPFGTGLLADAADVYEELRACETHARLKRIVRHRHSVLSDPVRRLLADSPSQIPASAPDLWEHRERLRSTFLAAAERFHAILLPVASDAALSMHEAERPEALTMWERLQPSRAVTLLGLPAVAVPAGVDDSGSPVGVQVVSLAYREAVALTVAQLIERLEKGPGICD